MTVDLRLQAIRSNVAELVALEGDMARRLALAQPLSTGYRDAFDVIQRLQPMVQMHREQLASCFKDAGWAEPKSGERSLRGPSSGPAKLSAVLRDLSLAFHSLVLNYAVLHQMLQTLYGPRLREIAPKHMKAHAEAALSTARLLPGVVAWQLAQEGMSCECICPMCGIGACGCVSICTDALTAAWHDARPVESESPGFTLLPPKRESGLARAGVQGGDLVLAVDGQLVHGRQQVQDALRKHVLGDEVRLLIQRGSEPPRELTVRHVSDYPKS